MSSILFDDDTDYETLDGKRRWCSGKCLQNLACAVISIALFGVVVAGFVFAIRPDWNTYYHSSSWDALNASVATEGTEITALNATIVAQGVAFNALNSTVLTLIPPLKVAGSAYPAANGSIVFDAGTVNSTWSVIDQNGQAQLTVANTAFNTTGGGVVKTFNNVLDDGTGKASVAGALTLNGLLYRSAETGKTATGTTSADAYTITKGITVFTTVASGTGAALPTPAGAGLVVRVFNRGANALTVYPPATHTLNGGATGTVSASASVEFVYGGATTWFF